MLAHLKEVLGCSSIIVMVQDTRGAIPSVTDRVIPDGNYVIARINCCWREGTGKAESCSECCEKRCHGEHPYDDRHVRTA